MFTLRVVPGYVATVVLNTDERIESVAVGNSSAWDVSPSKSGDHLFIKPLAAGTPTNVEVVTDSRHYSFLLQPTFEGDPEAAFQLRFDYASETPPAPIVAGPSAGPGAGPAGPTAVGTSPMEQPAQTHSYRLSGNRLAKPLSVSDDGTRTLFVFPDATTLPAIYAVDEQGQEMLVTTRRVDDGWVVDRIWRSYVLPVGRASARARRLDPRRAR